MSKYKHGEYIYLYWGGRPELFFVAGHMTCEEARAILEYEEGADYEFSDPVPMYARYSMEYNCDGEPGHVLREYKNPGRGRFPVMMAAVIRERIVLTEQEATNE
jgi:hypothetical protein